ncbi:hypothetical protein CR513_26074, partial [Mucuna pruriens]
MDRSMIDATSGGALMDKTPPATRHLISTWQAIHSSFGSEGRIRLGQDKQVINSRLSNTRHHLSNNNNNSRECLLKATLHLWRT